MHIKQGDTVEVISGEDRGARGEVQRVLIGKRVRSKRAARGGPLTVRDPNLDRVVVSGVNFIKKHQRRTGDVRTQVGIIEREAPIHISNVMLVCPHCNKATRVRMHVFENGTRARECRQCGQLIDTK
jgi:large subunit ribosomal protein L24